MWNPRGDGWVAGFTDGEGCFRIGTGGGGKRRTVLVPRFCIGLRADDAPILRVLREAFGGSISVSPATEKSPSPKATWTVAGKADLKRLLDYFDEFPLRSRKARDYAVWREAVLLYLAGRPSYALLDEMRAFKEALHDARQPVDEAPSLRLVEAS